MLVAAAAAAAAAAAVTLAAAGPPSGGAVPGVTSFDAAGLLRWRWRGLRNGQRRACALPRSVRSPACFPGQMVRPEEPVQLGFRRNRCGWSQQALPLRLLPPPLAAPALVQLIVGPQAGAARWNVLCVLSYMC